MAGKLWRRSVTDLWLVVAIGSRTRSKRGIRFVRESRCYVVAPLVGAMGEEARAATRLVCCRVEFIMRILNVALRQ